MKNSEAIDSELAVFLQNIHKLRIKHNLSEKEMAALLGISVKSLTQIESGEAPKNLDANVILKIYQVFGIRPNAQFTPLE